ncbi:hypothetical protein IRJ41_003408 [Triplophysa rosa]|uniref:Uncharacterized protein n=1 Tax=Triplophysa rosa TaxID=992332 RepID=A0A9W7WD70_TRIRA|nr:hypothetical protein IRJ41_003408 [Triplophysa rosa]
MPVPAAPSGPPLPLIPMAHSSWRPAPSTPHPATPSLSPPISWSRDSPVSRLDTSHCHSLASRRWLRDGASWCIVGNHFDRARGYQRRKRPLLTRVQSVEDWWQMPAEVGEIAQTPQDH